MNLDSESDEPIYSLQVKHQEDGERAANITRKAIQSGEAAAARAAAAAAIAAASVQTDTAAAEVPEPDWGPAASSDQLTVGLVATVVGYNILSDSTRRVIEYTVLITADLEDMSAAIRTGAANAGTASVSWSVKRRFDDFVRLQSTLKAAGCAVPALPDACESLDDNKIALHDFLTQVIDKTGEKKETFLWLAGSAQETLLPLLSRQRSMKAKLNSFASLAKVANQKASMAMDQLRQMAMHSSILMKQLQRKEEDDARQLQRRKELTEEADQLRLLVEGLNAELQHLHKINKDMAARKPSRRDARSPSSGTLKQTSNKGSAGELMEEEESPDDLEDPFGSDDDQGQLDGPLLVVPENKQWPCWKCAKENENPRVQCAHCGVFKKLSFDLSAKVTGYEKVKTSKNGDGVVVEYTMNIKAGLCNWKLRRTENQFHQLYNQLISSFGRAHVPSLPAQKTTLFGARFDPKHARARLRTFQKFLDELLRHPINLHLGPLCSWLNAESFEQVFGHAARVELVQAERVRHLRNSVDEFQARLSTETEQLSQWRIDCKEVRAEFIQMKTAEEQASAEVKALRGRLAVCEASRDEAEAERVSLRVKLKQATAELAEISKAHADSSVIAEENEDKYKLVLKDLVELTAEKDVIRLKHRKLEKQLAANTKLVKEHEATAQKATKDLADKLQVVASLRQKQAEAVVIRTANEEKLAQLETRADVSGKEYEQLQKQCTDQIQQLKDFKAKVETLQTTEAKLAASQTALATLRASSAAELGTLQKRAMEEASSLQQQLLEGDEALQTVRAEITRLTQAWKVENMALRSCRQELATTKAQVIQLQSETDSKNDKLVAIQSQVALLKQTREELAGSKKAAELLRERLTQTKTKHQESQRDLQAMQDKQDELASSREQLANARGQLTQTEKSLKAAEEKLTEFQKLQTALGDKERSCAKLKELLRERDASLKDAAPKLEELPKARADLADRLRACEKLKIILRERDAEIEGHKTSLKQYEKLKSKLDASQTASLTLGAQLKEKEKHVDDLKKLAGRSESILKELEKKKEECTNLENRLTLTKRKLKDKQQQLLQAVKDKEKSTNDADVTKQTASRELQDKVKVLDSATSELEQTKAALARVKALAAKYKHELHQSDASRAAFRAQLNEVDNFKDALRDAEEQAARLRQQMKNKDDLLAMTEEKLEELEDWKRNLPEMGAI